MHALRTRYVYGRALPLSALVTSILLAGCVDLEAVREFAKTSAATADYQAVVADYVLSPEHQRRYVPERLAPQWEADSRQRMEQKGKLEAAQSILVEYMNALGDIAADDLPNVDTEIDALGKALEGAKFVGDADAAISKETATAASGLAKILIRATLDHWRQKQTALIIKESNNSVQVVTEGLRNVVLKDFGASLDKEEEVVRKYFETIMVASTNKKQADTVPPLARILWQDRSDQIDVKRKKIKAYAEVLDKIAKGHADLYANIGKLDDKALAERLKQYIKDIQGIYKIIAGHD